MTRTESRRRPTITYNVYMDGNKVCWLSAKSAENAIVRAAKLCKVPVVSLTAVEA